jgi:glutaredoxin/glutathione-dependent peroxiredoxin
MPIAVGDRIPAATLRQMTPEGPREIDAPSLFTGRKVVLFGLPGAFTPTCSARHLPGFLDQFDALKAKGVDLIACVSVNDLFVMAAWGKDQAVGDKVALLADGSAQFSHAVDLAQDLTAFGMGVRSQRYALIAEDGVVRWLGIDPPGQFERSSAEAVLAAL